MRPYTVHREIESKSIPYLPTQQDPQQADGSHTVTVTVTVNHPTQWSVIYEVIHDTTNIISNLWKRCSVIANSLFQYCPKSWIKMTCELCSKSATFSVATDYPNDSVHMKASSVCRKSHLYYFMTNQWSTNPSNGRNWNCTQVPSKTCIWSLSCKTRTGVPLSSLNSTVRNFSLNNLHQLL